MVALLLIRGMTDIPFAVTAVNEFLAYRRSGNGLEEDDEILAVCLKGDLDAGLPIWHLADHEFGRTSVPVPATSGPVPTGAGLGIRESFSLSGILLDGSRDSTLGESLSAVMERVEQWSAPAGAMDDASVLALERCG